MAVIIVQITVTQHKSLKLKKITIFLIFILSVSIISSCESEANIDESLETRTEWRCGTHNGNKLWTGPRGGCYYYNSSNNKTYVDRSECNTC
jgi:hypothetical protein